MFDFDAQRNTHLAVVVAAFCSSFRNVAVQKVDRLLYEVLFLRGFG